MRPTLLYVTKEGQCLRCCHHEKNKGGWSTTKQWSFRGGTRGNAVPIVKNLPERMGTAFRDARERRSHC